MSKPNPLAFILLISTGILLSACGTSSTPENTKAGGQTAEPAKSGPAFTNIDIAAFKEKMHEENTVILDVRTPAETQSGMIDGAIQIDILQPGFQEKINQLDKTKNYLVYCKAGSRSNQACNIMAEAGFAHLFNLEGGYMAWEQQ